MFGSTGDVDESAEQVLAILREFGMPTVVTVVLPPQDAPLKVRAASKKLAAATLELQVSWSNPVHCLAPAFCISSEAACAPRSPCCPRSQVGV